MHRSSKRSHNVVTDHGDYYICQKGKSVKDCIQQSRKLKSCYGARNRFQEPSLELVAKLQRLAGRYDNPYAYLVPSPHSGTKVTDSDYNRR